MLSGPLYAFLMLILSSAGGATAYAIVTTYPAEAVRICKFIIHYLPGEALPPLSSAPTPQVAADRD